MVSLAYRQTATRGRGSRCPADHVPAARRSNSRSRLAVVATLSAVACLAACPGSTAKARGLGAQEGILNFGKVNERLYRGAQPDLEGLKSLKNLGVKLVINLRMPGEGWREEAAQTQANGMLYTNFPMSGISRPVDEQVRQILALLESFPDPVFIHCQHGCDRTGTIVACYRIQHDHWSSELALREARKYGISRIEFRMKRFVADFGRFPLPDLRQARAY